MNMSGISVSISGGIARDGNRGGMKNCWILKFGARQQPTARNAKQHMIGGIYDYPTVFDLDLGDHVLAVSMFIEQQQSPGVQTAAGGKVHKRIGRSATN